MMKHEGGPVYAGIDTPRRHSSRRGDRRPRPPAGRRAGPRHGGRLPAGGAVHRPMDGGRSGAAVGDAVRSVAEVAATHGVSWPTAHTAFIEHADALLTAPEPTTVLGIDETRPGKPRWVQDSDTERWRRGGPLRHRLRRSGR